MRSMNLNPQQFSTFLTPFGLRLPNTVREFEELQSHMRRIFHLTEHAPGNIGQSLHAPRQARAGTYYQGAQHAFTSTPSLVDQMSNSPGYGEEYAVHPAFDFQIPDSYIPDFQISRLSRIHEVREHDLKVSSAAVLAAAQENVRLESRKLDGVNIQKYCNMNISITKLCFA